MQNVAQGGKKNLIMTQKLIHAIRTTLKIGSSVGRHWPMVLSTLNEHSSLPRKNLKLRLIFENYILKVFCFDENERKIEHLLLDTTVFSVIFC